MTLLTALLSGPSEYRGRGVNHEGETFMGTLRVQKLLEGQGALLHYEAKVGENEVVHAECALLAPDIGGTLMLWPLMSELPGVLPHRAISERDTGATFASGSRSDRGEFREEITIAFDEDGLLTYAHAWGLPGGEFEDRSSCLLSPGDASQETPPK
jgi:hypothetical protein